MQTINAQTIYAQIIAAAGTAPGRLDITCAQKELKEKGTPYPWATHIEFKTQTGRIKLVNCADRLNAFAKELLKGANWSAFGGGTKPTTAKPRPAITWPSGPVKLVAKMLEDGQQGEAAALAVRKCGALFFMAGSTPFMAWAPQAVEGLPECLASVRSTTVGGKWQVIHLETGRKLGFNFNCASRKAAEANALNDWTNILSEEQRAKVPTMAKDHSTEDARAQYLAAAGITNTEDLQAEPAPVRKATKATAPAPAPAPVQAAPVAEVVAETIAAAQAAATIESATEAAAVGAIATTEAEETQAEELAAVAAMAEGQSHQAGRALIGRVAPAQVERGQVIASKSGNWSAVFFSCHRTGLPSMRFMHSDELGRGQDGGTYESGRERMADLQRKAKAADNDAAARKQAAEDAAKAQAHAEAAREAAANHAALFITLERLEGLGEACSKPQTFASFEDADRLLWAWAETAPKNSGYDKTRARVRWPDGTDYTLRINLVHHSRELPSLRDQMARSAEFWTGKRCPDHMTCEQYADTMSRQGESVRAFYAHILDLLAQPGHFSKEKPQHCLDTGETKAGAEDHAQAMPAQFERAKAQAVSLSQMIKQGINPADLVGLGINYSGDAANPGGEGAIVSFELTQFSERVTLQLEDGREWVTRAHSFNPGSGCRFAINWKMHGRPYLAQLAEAVASKKAASTAKEENLAQAFASETERLAAEYPYLTRVTRGGGKEAAQNVRIMLKRSFPGVKFGVTSDYSSISIKWTDGPTEAQVSEVVARFDIGRSDTHADYFYTEGTAWSGLFGGVQYLWTRRAVSPELVEAVLAQFMEGRALQATADDYIKCQGVFDWRTGDEFTRRKFTEALRSTPASAAPKAKA